VRPVTIKGSSRNCVVEPGEVLALVARLRQLGDAEESPLPDAHPAASFLEGLLGGSPRWRSTPLEEPEARAIVHVLDLMLAEGSLQEGLHCVRHVLRSDLGFDRE
jgi:hypothetical protein